MILRKYRISSRF